MKIKLLIAALTTVILSGCAVTSSGLTGDQLYELTHRTYEGVSKDQVLSAAQKLLRLADGDDFKITRTEYDVSATRNWVNLLSFINQGTDYWKIDVIEESGEVMIAVNVYTEAGMISNWGSNINVKKDLIETTALYDVFWARLEYLIGKRDDWMSCEKADERIKLGITSGSNDALCNSINIDDDTPS